MMHFDEWWNSAAADSFRAKHEDLDGEVFRTVWDAAQLGQAAIKKAEGTADDQGWSQSDMDAADALDGFLAAVPQPPACNQSMQPELATYSAQARNKKGIEQ